MAAVAEPKKDPAAKFGSQVDEQLAEATSRIRGHDLAFGGLLLAAMVLVYATAMILLDRYLVLPEWVRQLALAGFLAAAAGAAYWTLIRPLRRQVNPLYAAVQVEKTIEDAKNSVVGYVEAKERADVHPTVRAAMGVRAAKSVGKADLNRAVDHRSLLYAGGVAVAFLLALVVLFFAFRPAQFASLVGRTFAPFTADPIATRTQLTLTEPADGDTTVTAGQSVTIKVEVGGKIPDPEKPDRVRVLLRHNPAAANYEEVPMERGEHARAWQVRVPDYLVRNGFWYKVAGGDAETPEYRVTVRSLPLFSEFEVAYEYPPYTRRQPDATKDPNLEGLRGTKVTLTGRTNRTVKDGRMVFDPPVREPVVGRPVPDRPDSLRFELYLAEKGSYRLYFTSADGERNVEPPPFAIRVRGDEAPVVEITSPQPDDIQVPANGQLAVDATVGDDYGVASVTLKMRVVEPAARPLADRPYLGGQSLRREKDGTWPTSVLYKDSADFTKLTDAAGLPVELKDGMVIEYWVEATDIRTKPGPNGPVPDPQVGSSAKKRVRVTPPKVEPNDKADLDARKEKRQEEERKNNQDQQRRFDTENRDPNPPPKKEGDPNPPKQDPNAKGADKKNGEGIGDPMPPMGTPDPGMKPDTPPAPKPGEPMTPPDAKKGPEGMPPMDGMPQPMPGGTPMDPNNPGMGGMQPDTAPPPQDPKVRDQARRVEDALDQNRKNGGSGKGNPTPDAGARSDPSDPKNTPPMGDPPPDSPPKEGPKPDAGMNGGADSKPAGNVAQPPDPATPKPDTKTDPTGPMGGTPPPADAKTQPPAGAAGSDKTTPEPKKDPAGTPPMPMPGANPDDPPKPTEDPSGGGTGKPSTQQKPKAGSDTKPMTGPGGMPPSGTEPMGTPQEQPRDPAAGASQPKPMAGNEPGTDRTPDPKAGPSPKSDRKPDDTGGVGKPQTSPPPSDAKPAPKDDTPMAGGGMTEPKPGPTDGMGNPMKSDTPPGATTKPQATKPPTGDGPNASRPNPAEDRPPPDAKPTPNATAGGPQPDKTDPKDPTGPKTPGTGGDATKPDPQKVQEFENAVKDLTNPDPNKRQEARDKLDKTVGKENRQQIEDIAKGMNSNDPNERAAAQKKLDDLANKAGGQDPKADGKKDPSGGTAGQPKVDPKEVENAVKNLTSPDPKERDAARNTLDKAVGPDARKEVEDIANGLNSKDPKERQAAQKKLDDLKDRMARGGGDKKDPDKTPAGGGKVDPKEVENALRDLNDPDPNKRQQAKEKLDKMLGKGAGQEAETATKDANSDDLGKQAAGRKKLDELRNRADEMANKGPNDPKGPKGKELSPDEINDLAKKAGDLNSDDPAKRKAAEEAFDKQVGEDGRKKLQDAMKDPQKAEDLRRELEQMAKNGGGTVDPDGNIVPKGGGSNVPVREAIKDDPRNRLKSADLQLEDARRKLKEFEENRNNKELLQRLNMTDEEYERFLEEFRRQEVDAREKELARLKKEAEEFERAAKGPKGLPGTNVNDAGRVDAKATKSSGDAGVGGPVYAAPGFGSALQKFQGGASNPAMKKKP